MSNGSEMNAPLAPHLSDAARCVLAFDDAHRIALIDRDLWIGYSRARDAHARLERILRSERRMRPDNLLIVGSAGWHDERCKLCGSLLFAVVRDGAYAHVAMGTLVDDPTIRPSAHIFVGSKAPWFTITDHLPQYAEHIVRDKD